MALFEKVLKSLEKIDKDYIDQPMIHVDEAVYTIRDVIDQMKGDGFFGDIISYVSEEVHDIIDDALSFRLVKKVVPRTPLNKVLMVRPVSDQASKISYKWGGKVLGMLDSANIPYIDLGPDNVWTESLIDNVSVADAIFYFNHGGYDKLADSNKEVLVDTECVEVLDLKPVLTMACRSSRDLGPASVEAGSPIYLGYKEVFIFMNAPFDRLFSKPAVQTFKQMIQGSTADEALSMQKAEFAKKAVECSIIPGVGWMASAFLLWDLAMAKLDGDEDFRF